MADQRSVAEILIDIRDRLDELTELEEELRERLGAKGASGGLD